MSSRDISLIWALAAVFGAGAGLGATVVLGAVVRQQGVPQTNHRDAGRAGNQLPSFTAHPSETVQGRSERRALHASTTPSNAPSRNDLPEPWTRDGESAADVLARLEAAYLAQKLREVSARQSESGLPLDAAGGTEELDAGADEEAAGADEEAALRLALLETPEASAVQPVGRPSSSLSEAAQPGATDPSLPGDTPRFQADNGEIHVTQTTNQMVVVNSPTVVNQVVVSPPENSSQQGVVLPDGAFLGVSGPVFSASGSTSPVVVSNPALRSQRFRTKTPQSAHGRSPWDPIDMSRHHNPWQSTRLP